MSDETDYLFRRGRRAAPSTLDAGSIVESTDGGWVIRASDGELYDKDELKTMIEIRQKVVVSIDPLISCCTAPGCGCPKDWRCGSPTSTVSGG